MSGASPAAEVDESADEFERQQARSSRRARVLVAVIGLSAVLGVAGIATYVATRPPAKCDGKQLDAFMSTKAVPAGVIGQVCKLPAPLSQALAKMEQYPPDMQTLPVLKLLGDHHEMFAPSCSKLPGIVAESMQQLPRGEQTAFVVHQCGAAAFPFASEPALLSAPLDRLLLASAVHTALVDDDGATAARIAAELLDR